MTNVSDANMFYNLGKRDALIELFMDIRGRDINETLLEIAQDLLKQNDNPHVKYFVESQKDNKR